MKFLGNLLELIVLLIVLPFVLLFKLAVVLIVFLFLASPFILIGWIIWLIAT